MIVLFILLIGNLYLELSPKTALSTQDFLGTYYINSYLPALLREEEPQTVAAGATEPFVELPLRVLGLCFLCELLISP